MRNTTKAICRFFMLATFLFLTGCQPADSAATASAAAEVSVVAAENQTARNFYVVFDGSGSMFGGAPNTDKFRNKLEGAKWAAEQFAATVPDDVQLGMFVFDGKGRREVLSLKANNKAEFLAAVKAVMPNTGTGTPLGESMIVALKTLKRQYEAQMGYGEFRLLVVTDGEANDIGQVNAAGKLAAEYGIPVYTIGFGIGPNHSLRKYSRSYQDAHDAEHLKKALQEAGAELPDFDPKDFTGAEGN
jgi:uncharacterized protein with von Willebrand factor type A (vWA) domain